MRHRPVGKEDLGQGGGHLVQERENLVQAKLFFVREALPLGLHIPPRMAHGVPAVRALGGPCHE